MGLGWRLALAATLIGAGFVVQAASPARGIAKGSAKIAVKSVTQPDGSVIERLDLPLEGKEAASKEVAPATPEAWLALMLDPTRHALALKNPKLFAEWLDSVTEPRFMTALATIATEPETFPQAFGRFTNPSAARSWSELIDPNLFMRWMALGMDFEFSLAIFNRMADPGKFLRWGMYPGTPEAQWVLTRGFDSTTYGKWFVAGMDAKTYAPAIQALSPATPFAWASAFAGGLARSLSGGQPESEWLKFPSPERNSNPWLSGSASYRY